MNMIKLLLAFATWIVFGLIAGPSLVQLEAAIVVSLVISLALGYKELQKGYLLTWGTVLFFLFGLVTIVLMKNIWVASHMGVLSYGTLTAVTWGSLLIGHPFTMQYAKEEVDRSVWQNPGFIHANRVITAFWGVLFLISLGMNFYKLGHPELGWVYEVGGWVLIIIGLAFTVGYTNLARKRRLEAERTSHNSSLSSQGP
jgi:hypothetical protein